MVTGPDAETDLGEGDQGQECAQSDQRSSHSRPVALAQSFFSGTDQALAAGAEHAGVEASKGGWRDAPMLAPEIGREYSSPMGKPTDLRSERQT